MNTTTTAASFTEEEAAAFAAPADYSDYQVPELHAAFEAKKAQAKAEAAAYRAAAIHAFEKAGLGAAPFSYAGFEVKTWSPAPGIAPRAGSSCDYCGTAIANVFWVASADGRRFKVGSECIKRAGDAGLIAAVSRQAYAATQAKAAAKAAAAKSTLATMIADNAAALAALPHPQGFKDRATGAPLTLLDFAEWMNKNAGAAGRAKTIKTLSAALAS